MTATTIEARIRAGCLAFPEVTEKASHGAPAFFVAKRQFLMLWRDGHHGNDFPCLWCAAPLGAQEELVETDPDRFFRPPYVGGRGWIGVHLDGDVDWDEIAVICKDAYSVVAPPKLVAMLEAP
jgi:hypothetical protein